MTLKLGIILVATLYLILRPGETFGLVCENSVADIVLLVDTSGSINTNQWNEQIDFIRTLVSRFTIGPDDIQIGIVTFSNIIQSEFSLNRYASKQELLAGINAIQERGGTTHTSKGLAFVRTNAFTASNGDRTNAPNILIVITDGQSSIGYEPKSEAALLKEAGVKIIAIGVGRGIDSSELTDMASTQRHVFKVTDFTALPTILSEVQNITCQVDGGWSLWTDDWSDCSQTCGSGVQYRERTCTKPAPSVNGEPCQGAAREERACSTDCPTPPLQVDGSWSPWTDDWSDCSQTCGSGVQYRERTCTNPAPSASGEPCQGAAREERACSTDCPTPPPQGNLVCVNAAPADVVFLVDTSGSISHSEWEQQIQFIRTMVDGFTIGPNDVQIGIVTFATTVENEFDLNRYTDKQGVMAGIDGVHERSGNTHTSAGLELVRTHSFDVNNGDRSNAPNILIVITDGHASRKYEPGAEAALLRQAGVKIIAIGVGIENGKDELETMASGQQYVFEATDFTALSTILNEVQTVTCEN